MFSLPAAGHLRGLAVACWTTDHYYTRVRISAWTYSKVVSSLTSLHYLWRSLGLCLPYHEHKSGCETPIIITLPAAVCTTDQCTKMFQIQYHWNNTKWTIQLIDHRYQKHARDYKKYFILCRSLYILFKETIAENPKCKIRLELECR